MKWFCVTGNESDVVLSSRIRLARNLRNYPFPIRLDKEGVQDICATVKEILQQHCDIPLSYLNIAQLPKVQAISLAERHLISAEFVSSDGALLLSESEDIGIMLCEEDHVRLQVIRPGLALEEAYQKADELDDILEQQLDYAFDERIGYLTQCPTNLGTGMRASVMLHLPALASAGSISRLSATVAKLGLTLRSAYSEENPQSDIYQLSNQVTLGISEQAALKNLNSIIMQIVSQERRQRESLAEDEKIKDKIHRAYGILSNATLLSSAELFQLSSLVRLGVYLKLLDVDLAKLNEWILSTQPATLNAANGGGLSAMQRDFLRAQIIRTALND